MSCCKDCKDRTLGCHSVCEHYLKYRAELDKTNEARRKYNEVYVGREDSIMRMQKSRCTNGIVKCGR